ncbi:hypothetical protein H9P43_007301 [Blastocladiella emersonii ATCC 22665]|nr:hypothetical protein H9P43_007301 [Blastocladiella emersonii ATCC 22665]
MPYDDLDGPSAAAAHNGTSFLRLRSQSRSRSPPATRLRPPLGAAGASDAPPEFEAIAMGSLSTSPLLLDLDDDDDDDDARGEGDSDLLLGGGPSPHRPNGGGATAAAARGSRSGSLHADVPHAPFRLQVRAPSPATSYRSASVASAGTGLAPGGGSIAGASREPSLLSSYGGHSRPGSPKVSGSFASTFAAAAGAHGYGDLTPASAAHAAATLTELEFLQSMLDPGLTRHDMHLLVGARVQKLLRDDDAGRLGKMSPWALAVRRLPAIMLTVVLEMGVGAMVGTFSDVLEKFVVLVNFMPMVSSICGNIGLQASTSTLRALATGHASHTSWKSISKVLWREFTSAFCLGILLLAGLTGVIALWTNSLRTGLVSGLSIMLSASAAGILGSLAPIFFKRLGFDPALCAGPLETAVQDVVGISIYLAMGRLILK